MLSNFILVAALALSEDVESGGRILVGLGFVFASLAVVRGAVVETSVVEHGASAGNAALYFLSAAVATSGAYSVIGGLASVEAWALIISATVVAANEDLRWRAIYSGSPLLALQAAVLWLVSVIAFLLFWTAAANFADSIVGLSAAAAVYGWTLSAGLSFVWMRSRLAGHSDTYVASPVALRDRLLGGLEVGSQAIGEAAIAAVVGLRFGFADVASYRLALSAFAPANAVAFSLRSSILMTSTAMSANSVVRGLAPFAATAVAAVASHFLLRTDQLAGFAAAQRFTPALLLVAAVLPSRLTVVWALLAAASLRAQRRYGSSVLLKFAASVGQIFAILWLSRRFDLPAALAIAGFVVLPIIGTFASRISNDEGAS